MPQPVPAMTLPLPSTQTAVPVAHETTPVLQDDGLPLQAPPDAHITQVPLPSQTMLVPQPVPAVLGVPSRHVCTPVVHEVTPFRQAARGLVVQARPGVQAVHCPLALQTWLVPQVVPAAFGVPSAHVCAPVEHAVMPLKQVPGLPVQDDPAVQVTQAPLP